MTVTTEPEAYNNLVDALLQLNSRADQTARLSAFGLLNQDGLSRLLDTAVELARNNPGQSRQLTMLCTDLANEADAPGLVPRAAYIRAQTEAINGEFETAVAFIKQAHQAYMVLGDELQALRTNVGLMNVLIQTGRYDEALETGNILLKTIQANPQYDQKQTRLLTTLANHNLGICYHRMGQYEKASTAYGQAEKGYQHLLMWERVGDVLNDRAVTLLHLGRVSDALNAFEAAVSAHTDAGSKRLQAIGLNNIGEANLLLGHYTHSLEALDKAEALLRSLDALTNEQIGLLHRAHVYLALNLYPEALSAYRQAEKAFAETGMRHYQARALWGLGAVLTAQGNYEESEAVLQQAADLFEQASNQPLLASVLLEQASLQAARGEMDTAIQTVNHANALISGQQWPVQQLYIYLRLADWETAVPQIEANLQSAQALSDQLGLPQLRYRIYRRWGLLRQQQGLLDEAQHYLETAVNEIEQLRGNVAQEAMRISFLHDKIDAYEELMQFYLDMGETAVVQAFTVAEQAKSRALVDLLTGVLTISEQKTSVEQTQALQADLNAIYNQFLAGGIGDDDDQAIPLQKLQIRAQEIEQALRQIALQNKSDATTIVNEPFAGVLPFAQIQAHLSDKMTLITYHILGDEIVAFVVVENNVHVVRKMGNLSAVQILLQQLLAQWERFRVGDAFVTRHMPRLLQTTQRVLQQLYDILFAPLNQLLTGYNSQRLTIVPHGVLHQIPFQVLFDGEQYLLERYEIAYAPSATVFALCQQIPARTAHRSLVVGVADEAIPAVQDEVTAVSQQLPAVQLYVDEFATKETVKTAVAAADVIHLACHGLFRADNPMFSALKLYDGWLTAVDILPLNMEGALVTLSACESGRNQVVAGDELIGLTRAFLGAGVATLVVSLWLVHDQAATRLMKKWYEQLQDKHTASRAEALRSAQLWLKEEYQHPYYWASFVLTGQR